MTKLGHKTASRGSNRWALEATPHRCGVQLSTEQNPLRQRTKRPLLRISRVLNVPGVYGAASMTAIAQGELSKDDPDLRPEPILVP